MGRLPRSATAAAGSLPRAGNPISDTDSTRPVWLQLNDHRGDVTVRHGSRCHRSRGTDCDLPAWPVSKPDLDTRCYYAPTGELWQRVYGGSYVTPRSRKPFRRSWFSSERTAQRVILRSLTRDANSGGEIDEDRIDDRQTGRYRMYGGGWWD